MEPGRMAERCMRRNLREQQEQDDVLARSHEVLAYMLDPDVVMQFTEALAEADSEEEEESDDDGDQR